MEDVYALARLFGLLKILVLPLYLQATSELAAEKQIQQLLFPRSRRKKLRTLGVGHRDVDPF